MEMGVEGDYENWMRLEIVLALFGIINDLHETIN